MNTFSISSYCFSFTELWAVQIAGEASANTQMGNSCRDPWFYLYCIHTNCPIASKSGSQIAILKLGKPSKGFTCSLICIWLTCLTAWLTRYLTHSYCWDFKWCHSSCWGCQRKSCWYCLVYWTQVWSLPGLDNCHYLTHSCCWDYKWCDSSC